MPSKVISRQVEAADGSYADQPAGLFIISQDCCLLRGDVGEGILRSGLTYLPQDTDDDRMGRIPGIWRMLPPLSNRQ